MPKKSVLLPSYVVPERYRIMLRPDLSSCTFTADETIYLNITKSTNTLVFHALDLKTSSANILAGKNSFKVKKITYNKTDETVSMVLPKSIRGKAELNLKISGVINNKMCGFYRSNYVVNGEEKILATTQFESTDARRAFVCVDEPAAKAVFDITFMVPKDKTVISNTHIIDIKEHDGPYKTVSFAPSPKMSTYLVAFIVGDFEFVEKKTEDNILVRVFVTPGKKKQAEFALDVAGKMLSFYNKYFKIKYPLPVLDLIAIPDFASGAMENWGAVTYRETALLIDPEHSSAAARQRVALVIAHELAHQWFGNLATMEWWTHLWLNEGFASWIEYLALDHVFPEWDMWTQFAYADFGLAMDLDSMDNTHAIEVEVNHPKEISEIFDTISYSKGASVIRMLADYLGEKDFRQGLHNYLIKHQYANAKTEDLWRAFEKASGKPIGKIMKNWTKNPGYPVLRVALDKNGVVVATQERFLLNPKSKINKKRLWSIPVGYQMEGPGRAGPKSKKYFVMNSRKLNVPETIKGSNWINLNHNQSSFYRVLYDKELAARLLGPLEKNELLPANRFGLLNDSFAFSKANLISMVEYLKLLMSYKHEKNYTVWRDLSMSLDELDNLFWGEPYYEKFQSFSVSLFSEIVKNVGWRKKENEGHLDSLSRELVLAQAGKYGDKEVIKEAKKMFADHISNKSHINPDLRIMVYSLVAKNGSDNEYNELLKLYDGASLQEERNRIGLAMCRFSQKHLIKKSISFLLSSKVRNQDFPILAGALGANNYAHDDAWKMLKDNWKMLYGRYQDGHMLPRIIPAVVDDFKTKQKADDIEEFFKKNKSQGTERSVAQVVEKIRARAAWFERNRKDLEKFLK